MVLLLTGSLCITSIPLAAQRTIARAPTPGAVHKNRVALIIGNGAYLSGPLKNPVNDARAVDKRLKKLGFKTILGTDLDYRGMRRMIADFGRRVGRNGVGLFYFAGHGMQVGGRNYLIPIDARIEHQDHVSAEGIDLHQVMARLSAAGGFLNIIILDACRDNPFARSFRSGGSRGLAQVVAPPGTVIAYATAPGQTAADGKGRHGTFTEALLNHLDRPGLGLERLLKDVGRDVARKTNNRQRPWVASDFYDEFKFATATIPPTTTTLPPTTTTRVNTTSTSTSSAPARPTTTTTTRPASGNITPEEARRFITSFLRTMSANDVARFVKNYAGRVDYFGVGTKGRKFIEKDKKYYFKRWPNREYGLLGELDLSIPSRDQTAVTFRMKFRVADAKRWISGIALENLVLTRESGRIVITKETSKVLSRKKGKIGADN